MKQPYTAHLKSSKDLETPYAAVRAGFIALALERNRRATPFVAQARALRVSAARAKSPLDLLRIQEIQPALLTAAGVSDKAANHLEDADKVEAVRGLIETFLEPAGINFVEELIFRFLLTRGDTLGGSMRNIGGFMAQRKLTRAILAFLRNSGQPYLWMREKALGWAEMPTDDADVELQVRGLSWKVKRKPRTMLYNLTIPIVGNNIDLCLFDCDSAALTKDTYKSACNYLALGELKGGIDPAGADEHWKTARTALHRIHTSFLKLKAKPKTFFVGAAVELKMAAEIWAMLISGELDNAANLTDDDQIASVTRWLCTL